MKNRLLSIIIIIFISLTLSSCNLAIESQEEHDELRYTMYIGLTDKDTYTQLISNEEAEIIVSEIALKYVDGYTQLIGKGAYKDDKEIFIQENTIVYVFYYASEEQIHKIADEVLSALNQSAILIEKQNVSCYFY